MWLVWSQLATPNWIRRNSINLDVESKIAFADLFLKYYCDWILLHVTWKFVIWILNSLVQAIRFFESSNLRVEGLKIKNSPKFHFRFDECQNVHVEKLIIKSPALSPNTDGIHIENTTNVNIHNSVISNGNSINYTMFFLCGLLCPPFFYPGIPACRWWLCVRWCRLLQCGHKEYNMRSKSWNKVRCFC